MIVVAQRNSCAKKAVKHYPILMLETHNVLCCRLENGEHPVLSNSRIFPHLCVSLSELKAITFNDEQEKIVNKVSYKLYGFLSVHYL